MPTTQVLRLEDFRDRRRQRLHLTESLLSSDSGRCALVDHLARVARALGAERAATVWVDEYGPGIVHPHAVLDFLHDRPRRAFSPEPLKRARELGVPGVYDTGGLRQGWSLAVSLGSDGMRSWYLVADAAGPRPALSGSRREEVMFLAGECSAVVLHRDLDLATEEDGERAGVAGRFPGWPILADLEGREEDDEERLIISLRFVVGRLPRLLVEDDLALPEDRLRGQAEAARAELRATLGSERAAGDRRLLEDVLDAFEVADLEALGRSLVALGGSAEERGHLSGAAELYRTAYEIAAAVGEADVAVDAARFAGRTLRRQAHWAEASAWYGVARRVAEAADRPGAVALALSGLANSFRERGDLSGARAVLGEALPFAEASGDSRAVGEIHHGFMAVDHLAGNLEDAMCSGWRAVSAHDEAEDRCHALAGLGGVLVDLGELDAAEDAWAVVRCLTGTSYYRLYAADALSHISALRGDREAFRDRARESDALGWEAGPKPAKAEILLYRGLSHVALGELDEARVWLHRAVAFAQMHGFDRTVRRAQEALGTVDEIPVLPWRVPETNASAEREAVRGGLRALRLEVAGRSA